MGPELLQSIFIISNMRNILILLLISSSAFCEEVTEEIEAKEVKKESETDVAPKRHHEDDKINEKMEQYIKLLKRKKNAIDKFLRENYSDFNHSDYTPEEYVSHPINAYMLMKRTTVIWQNAKHDILDPASDNLWAEIEQDIKN